MKTGKTKVTAIQSCSPKECRNYITSGKCRFNEHCACMQSEHLNLNHRNEIELIKDKVERLNEIIQSIGYKIKSLEIELNK